MKSTSESEQPTSDGAGGETPRPEPTRKDAWDKLGTIGRLVGSLVTASAMVVVGVMGYLVNQSINTMNASVKASEMNAQRVEFLANHKMAISEMRGQAFASVGQYMAPELDKDNRKVALLAGLHSSYSEYFDTRPIFEAFARHIKGKDARHELRRLAKRVARRQARSMKMQGGESTLVTFTLHNGDGKANKSFPFAGHDLNVEISNLTHKDDVMDSLDVVLAIMDDSGAPQNWDFTVSYMDSPFLDNITIRHEDGSIDHIAVMLSDIAVNGKDEVVKLELLHFPTSFRSPFDVRMEALQKLARASPAEQKTAEPSLGHSHD